MDFDELEEIKAETETLNKEQMANAIANVAKNPENMVRVAVSNKIANKVQTDQSTIERIDKSAD